LSGLLCLTAVAQIGPTITKPPQGLSRSLGENATFRVIATGDDPLTYQWRFNNSDLPNAVSPILNLANLTTAQAGSYSVLASNAFSAVTSEPVVLDVDTLFSLKAASPIIRDNGFAPAWGDYDDDGFIDLYGPGESAHQLYHNERDGTFTKVGRTNAIVTRTFSASDVGAGRRRPSESWWNRAGTR